MRAACIAAFSDIRCEFPESVEQIFFFKEIEPHKIQHGKAGGVGEITGIRSVGQREELHGTCGVPSALNFLADSAGLQGEVRKQHVQKRGFSHTGCAGKGGDFSVQVCLYVAADRVRSGTVPAADGKYGEAGARIDVKNLCSPVRVQLAFSDDDDRFDMIVFQDAEQLVGHIRHGSGGCCGKADKTEIKIGKRWTDQRIAAGEDGCDHHVRPVGNGHAVHTDRE